jgi:hypothetical protein
MEGRTDGRKDGSVIISLLNLVDEGIISRGSGAVETSINGDERWPI